VARTYSTNRNDRLELDCAITHRNPNRLGPNSRPVKHRNSTIARGPGEVEEALAQHPDIREAAVIGFSDDQYGQRLRSFIVVCPGASLTGQDVKDYVSSRLARFKVPRDVLFVDVLPRNPSGKMVKRLLGTGSAGREGH
jgi:acyl-coenzyme A synthetase/AMP-(fatty) acid ligase